MSVLSPSHLQPLNEIGDMCIDSPSAFGFSDGLPSSLLALEKSGNEEPRSTHSTLASVILQYLPSIHMSSTSTLEQRDEAIQGAIKSLDPAAAQTALRNIYHATLNHYMCLFSNESSRKHSYQCTPVGTCHEFRGSRDAGITPHLSILSNSILSQREHQPTQFTREADKGTDGDLKRINQYLVMQTIGKGTSGKVKLAYDTERDTTVAIKVLRRERFRTAEKQQLLQREIDVMKRLRHRNLVSLYEVIDDPDSDKLYLVMQYIDDGVLLKIDPNTLTCTPLDTTRATEVARQLIAGLTYLHQHRIVHRDIKPENILQNRDGTVYLCDFGLSEEFVNGAESTVSGWHGSPLFMAPEVHALRSGDSNRPVDGYAADVYSLGATFYLMLTGRLPYLEAGATHSIDTDALPSEGWTNIVLGMMHPNPQSRLSLSHIRHVVKSSVASMSLMSDSPLTLLSSPMELLDLSGATPPPLKHRNNFSRRVPDTSYSTDGTLGPSGNVSVIGEDEKIHSIFQDNLSAILPNTPEPENTSWRLCRHFREFSDEKV